MTRRSLLCPRSTWPSRCAGSCHGDCPLSFVWDTSQGSNACVQVHVAAGNLSERTLLPCSSCASLRALGGFSWVWVVGGVWVWVCVWGVRLVPRRCWCSLFRILCLASNSFLDSSFLDSLCFLLYDAADGRKTIAIVGVVLPLGSPACCGPLAVLPFYSS